MPLRKVKQLYRVRGEPKCHSCGSNIKQLFREGESIYIKYSTHKTKYYCNSCKKALFEGVKLRQGMEVEEKKEA